MSLEELILACAERGDAAAWEEFIRRFHELIASVVLRTARRWGSNSPVLIEDLIQDTYLKMCADPKRLLAEFVPQHPEAFYGYLKVVTANVVHDYFRAQRSQKRGSGQFESSVDESTASQPVASTSREEDVHLAIFMKEVDGILRSEVTGEEQKRDLTIFWLYYRFGMPAAAIARLPSICLTVKGVESVLQRLKYILCQRITKSQAG